MGPLGRFVRARLRRRIFAWFLGGIVTTAAVVSAVMIFVARIQEPEWNRTWARGREWFGAQFVAHWADAPERERFARETAEQLGANVDLYDASGALLLSTGARCTHGMIEAPVKRGAEVLGKVVACVPHPHGVAWRWLLMLSVGLLVVWKASGGVARRLARPLDELVAVVRRIGEGDLSARTKLGCQEPDEIGVVADAVNDMAARIEKQLADQRELLATVSHELRTPLARLRIISEIARDTGAQPKTWDELDREIAEMDALVGELLANSRLEFGQLARRELSVRDVGTRAVERAGLPATALSVTGEADTLSADPTLLLRALANLFDNATRHGGGADALEVTVTPAEVTFEVLDRGPGITGDGAALFEKFNRGQNGDGANGLGLGLALVKRIALAHGGQAWAKAREGGGARVGFSVPRSA